MPWYEDFFDEDYMRLHLCGGTRQAERAPAECDFVVKALGLTSTPMRQEASSCPTEKPGDRILDLCCGQGRHSVELARRGFDVTGADLSEYLLDLAKKAAEEAGVSVCFHRCDMRELTWENEFDAVINMWTAFGYLETDEENEKVLRAVRKALKTGGRFLLDLPNRDVFVKMIPNGQRSWYEHEGHFVLDEHTWDAVRGRLQLRRIIVTPHM